MRPKRVSISPKDEILLHELELATGMDSTEAVSFLIKRHARQLAKWFVSDPYQVTPQTTEAIAPDYPDLIGAIAPEKLPPLEL